MSVFIGAKTRRVRMDNQEGAADIPSVTPVAEHLSTLKTLKEVRDKWVRNTGLATPFVGTFGVMPGLGLVATTLPRLGIKKKRTRTPVIVYDIGLVYKNFPHLSFEL
jgi:hypothetical protein